MKNNKKIIYILVLVIIILALIFVVLLLNKNKISVSYNKSNSNSISKKTTTISSTTKSQVIAANKKYYCVGEGDWVSNAKCYHTFSYEASVKYDCTEGINMYDGTCLVTWIDPTTYEYQEKKIVASKSYYCVNNDYKLEGTTCKKTYTYDANFEYTCQDGYYLVGEKCRIIK